MAHDSASPVKRRASRRQALAMGAVLGAVTACSLGDLVGNDEESSEGNPSTPAALVFTVQPGNARLNETIAPAPEVMVTDAGGSVDTAFGGSITLTLTTNPSGATLLGATTRGAQRGVVAFADLAVDQVGAGYRLAAAADGIPATTSAPFDIIGEGQSGEPATLAGLSGDAQEDTVAAPLGDPYVVRVADAEGQPVAGVTVTWSVTSGGGTITPTTSLTGQDGTTSAVHSLGTATGTNVATAAVDGLDGSPVEFTATASHATPAVLAFTVEPSDAAAGSPITPAVEVTASDQYGNTATSFTGTVTVSISTNPGAGTLAGTTSRAASGGVAEFSDLSIDQPGDGYRLSTSASGLSEATSNTFDITGGGGEPITLTPVSGDGQTGTVGESLDADYVVAVTDADDDPVAGVVVTWTVTAGGGSVSPTTSTTNDDGRASTRHTLGTAVGTHSVSAEVDGASPVTFTSTSTHAAAVTLEFTAQPSAADVDETITPAVEVTASDQYGNTATGFTGTVTVSISTNPGGGTLAGTTSRAASGGVAEFSDLSIDQPGNGYRLSASASGLSEATSNTFDITGGGGGDPTTLTRVSGDGQTGTVGEALDAPYVVSVTDANGDPVAGVAVDWTVTVGGGSVSPGTSTTDAQGQASTTHTLGSGAGTHSVQASVTDLSPVTFSATAAAGAPVELVFTTQPSDAGIGEIIAPAVQVTVRDQFGNTVTGFSGSITMGIAPLTGTPGATLSGTLTQPVSNGVATFDDLSIDLLGVGYRLQASGDGLTEDSAAFDILL